MQKLRNKLIALAAVGILAALGTLMNSSKVAAQGPPGGMAVNIVNPLPVPVSGSTTVSGTVAATQSGAWNVGISGTPSVNITNTPTVNLANVPLLFRNADDPGRIPYQSTSDMTSKCAGNNECFF